MTSKLWGDFSDGDKQFFRGLKATFVLAPREMSQERVVQIVKSTLSKGPVLFGIAVEKYVNGFEGQRQFRTLDTTYVMQLAEKIALSSIPKKLYVLKYPQSEVNEVIRALRPRKAVVVRGSYLYAFHLSSTYALLEKRGIPFEYSSPFVDETEALRYLSENDNAKELLPTEGTKEEMFDGVRLISKQSYDYSFQTGVVLAEKIRGKYRLIDAACNEVVPFQTYALHYGNAREIHHVEHQGNATHYDTIHAEMNLLVRSMQQQNDFKGKSLFINTMPCPNCARTLSKTGLKEVFYQNEHSSGYAKKLLERSGIKVIGTKT